jgi:hypothetical protein
LISLIDEVLFGATRGAGSGAVTRRSLGRQFGWLWCAYAASTVGTWLAFDAFPLIAILVLHAGPIQVSVLAAAGLAVGAVAAVPLGPWAEFRRAIGGGEPPPAGPARSGRAPATWPKGGGTSWPSPRCGRCSSTRSS